MRSWPSAPVLLADVGGTHVRFALADPARAAPLLDASIEAFRVADFADFTAAARAYLAATGARPARGVFAFAGPLDDGEVRLTNHPWTVVRARVQAELGLAAVAFVNDFAAMSLGVTLLGTDDVRTIGAAGLAEPGDAAAPRTFAVLGPGTGLGVGALLLRGGRAIALATEGGHSGFAPRSEEEIEILRRLAARFGRVSNERLLSGSGLVNLYRALGEIHATPVAEFGPEDITHRAASGEDAGCIHAVEVFCELLGVVAGDLVLAFGAWDGAYLAGGLTPMLLPWLARGGFRRRFEDKGRFAAKLAQVPTLAIVHPQPGLLGAAAFALRDGG